MLVWMWHLLQYGLLHYAILISQTGPHAYEPTYAFMLHIVCPLFPLYIPFVLLWYM